MDDEIVYQSSPPLFKNFPLLTLMFFILIPVFGVGLIALLYQYYVLKNTVLTITNSEIRLKSGIFTKNQIDVNIDGIRTIIVHQNILQRIFNVGNVEVFTSGDYPELVLGGFPEPSRIRELLQR